MCRRVKWIRIMTFNGDQPELTASRRLWGRDCRQTERRRTLDEGEQRPAGSCPRLSTDLWQTQSTVSCWERANFVMHVTKPSCRRLSTSLSFQPNGGTFFGSKNLIMPNHQSEEEKNGHSELLWRPRGGNAVVLIGLSGRLMTLCNTTISFIPWCFT